MSRNLGSRNAVLFDVRLHSTFQKDMGCMSAEPGAGSQDCVGHSMKRFASDKRLLLRIFWHSQPSGQVFDYFFDTVFGDSCALMFYPSFFHAFCQSSNQDVTPFGTGKAAALEFQGFVLHISCIESCRRRGSIC